MSHGKRLDGGENQMNPGQYFMIILLVLFFYSCYATIRHDMFPFFLLMSVTILLGTFLGTLLKIAWEVFTK